MPVENRVLIPVKTRGFWKLGSVKEVFGVGYDSLPDGIDGEPSQAFGTDFFEDVFFMPFDSADADVEAGGNLAEGFVVAEQANDVYFAVGKVEVGGLAVGFFGFYKFTGYGFRHAVVIGVAMFVNGLYGFYNFFNFAVFGQKSGGTCSNEFGDVGF